MTRLSHAPWGNAKGMNVHKFYHTNRPEFYFAAFLVFCTIVLSYAGWYDLRIYAMGAARRSALYDMLTLWVLAQFLLFFLTLPALARNIIVPAWVWGLASLPYFIVGLFDRNFTPDLWNDIARYSLPLGWVVYSAWSLKHLSGRQVLTIVFGALLAFVLIRTPLHTLLSHSARIRYGTHWELFLVAALSLFPFFMPKRYLLLASAAILIVVVTFLGGQTRTLIFGTVVIAGLGALAGIITTGWRPLALAPAIIAMLAAGLPMTPLTSQWLPRLDITEVVTAASSDAPAPPSPAKPATTAPEQQGQVPKTVQSSSATNSCDTQLNAIHKRWQDAVVGGDLSLNARFAESDYFLKRMTCDPRTFWFGGGAGSSVLIKIGDYVRPVRGAHNTYVTLLYRHGVIFGSILILFVALYGLRKNWMQFRATEDPAWKVLLLSLMAYRLVVIPLSTLHQGLFDDPIVWLGIVIAAINPVPSAGSIPDGKTWSH